MKKPKDFPTTLRRTTTSVKLTDGVMREGSGVTDFKRISSSSSIVVLNEEVK
jgi:hypothetical protein